MEREFTFDFEELGIEPADLGELMGFGPGEIPEPFPELIEAGLKTAPGLCHLRGGYIIFSPVVFNPEQLTIGIGNTFFKTGKVVYTQLKKATSAALFACTAGAGISGLSKKLMAEGDMLAGYVFDVLGSVAVEKAINKIEAELKKEVSASGSGISTRFSPGYCEWDVAGQQQLFSQLPENFCGISLSESSLMSPIKSVSGIIGIGKGMEQKGYQCNWCNDLNCIYGRIRRKKTSTTCTL